MNPILIAAAVTASLAGLIFGFDVAVISGAEQAIQQHLGLSDAQIGTAVSSALWGTIVGCIFAGFASDAFGRRTSLIVIALMYFISAIGSALAWDLISFIAFRVLGGIGVGASSVIAAMYIAEISPAKFRGMLVGTFQLNIVLGILVAFLSNFVIDQAGRGGAAGGLTDAAAIAAAHAEWKQETGWRWMMGVEAAPAALFFVLLFFNPRSPRWLVAKGREDEARRVLERVGTDTGDLDAEMSAIRESLSADRSRQRTPLFTRRFLKPILLVVALASFNQLSGINAVMYYAPRIFEGAGASESAMFLFPVGLGLANLVFTLVGLALIDRAGRKKLLLVGSIGYIASLATASFAFFSFGPDFSGASTYVVLGALAVFIASHAVGQGAVIWVYIGEVFPNSVRGKGQSLGAMTHWVWAAVISATFPPLFQNPGGGMIFAMFTLAMLAQLAWVLLFVPETKGVPLEEIESELGIRDA